MKLAIMQPYLFPYIGYFQLVAAVNKFVFYDDVNFIKNGWINRNTLLISDKATYITVPLVDASPFKRICDVKVAEGDHWRKKIKRSVEQSYSKAPYFHHVFPLLSNVVDSQSVYIADLARDSVTTVAHYLGIETEFKETSRQYGNSNLSGEQRVLDIATKEQASEYYNLPGGRNLYSESVFQAMRISLHFVTPNLMPYPQRGKAFHPGLSILDVLMFNSREAVLTLLSSGHHSRTEIGLP